MNRAKRVFVLLLAMVTVVLTACGGGKQAGAPQTAAPAEPAKSAPAQKAAEKITVRVGGTAMASLKHYPVIMANTPEIKNLTGVEFEFVEIKSTGQTRKEMQLGNLDFGLITSTDLMLDASNDIQIVSVLTTSPLEALIVNSTNKNDVKSVKDLAGKPVGVSAIGSATHNMLNSILVMNGVDPRDVKVMPIGADVAKPFAENQVVAAVTFEPYVFDMVQSGKAVLLQDARFPQDIQKIFGVDQVPWTVLAVRGEAAQKNPALVNRLRNAIDLAQKKMHSSTPEELIKLLPQEMQTPQNVALYKTNIAAFPRDTAPKKAELDAIVNNLKAIKAIPADFSMGANVIFGT